MQYCVNFASYVFKSIMDKSVIKKIKVEDESVTKCNSNKSENEPSVSVLKAVQRDKQIF